MQKKSDESQIFLLIAVVLFLKWELEHIDPCECWYDETPIFQIWAAIEIDGSTKDREQTSFPQEQITPETTYSNHKQLEVAEKITTNKAKINLKTQKSDQHSKLRHVCCLKISSLVSSRLSQPRYLRIEESQNTIKIR